MGKTSGVEVPVRNPPSTGQLREKFGGLVTFIEVGSDGSWNGDCQAAGCPVPHPASTNDVEPGWRDGTCAVGIAAATPTGTGASPSTPCNDRSPAQVVPQVVGLPPGYVLVQQDWEPLP